MVLIRSDQDIDGVPYRGPMDTFLRVYAEGGIKKLFSGELFLCACFVLNNGGDVVPIIFFVEFVNSCISLSCNYQQFHIIPLKIISRTDVS